ncbi:MAG: serine O-acetyltransferase [Leptolyngbyaceae bacterium]|nr:serine O-acetyltransferase [Leptolyngbyaceae bacterium]
MLSTIAADLRIIFERDPAARNWLEVLLCYPGLQALVLHRFAHFLYRLRLPLIPRLISHLSRFFTGIEIHPGAQIGKGVFIDHGMGVVIGETAIVGDYCLIYQGVTLGGTGKETGKRHPTLGENVVVGAGAKVLGNLQIGTNVRIGAGSVVLRDVPSDCTVVGVPGRIVYRAGERVDPLEHGQLPDSEAKVIRLLVDRIEALEQHVQDLQSQLQTTPASHVASPNGFSSHADLSSELSESPEVERELCSVSSATGQRSSNQCQLRDREIEEFFNGSGI